MEFNTNDVEDVNLTIDENCETTQNLLDLGEDVILLDNAQCNTHSTTSAVLAFNPSKAAETPIQLNKCAEHTLETFIEFSRDVKYNVETLDTRGELDQKLLVEMMVRNDHGSTLASCNASGVFDKAIAFIFGSRGSTQVIFTNSNPIPSIEVTRYVNGLEKHEMGGLDPRVMEILLIATIHRMGNMVDHEVIHHLTRETYSDSAVIESIDTVIAQAQRRDIYAKIIRTILSHDFNRTENAASIGSFINSTYSRIVATETIVPADVLSENINLLIVGHIHLKNVGFANDQLSISLAKLYADERVASWARNITLYKRAMASEYSLVEIKQLNSEDALYCLDIFAKAMSDVEEMTIRSLDIIPTRYTIGDIKSGRNDCSFRSKLIIGPSSGTNSLLVNDSFTDQCQKFFNPVRTTDNFLTTLVSNVRSMITGSTYLSLISILSLLKTEIKKEETDLFLLNIDEAKLVNLAYALKPKIYLSFENSKVQEFWDVTEETAASRTEHVLTEFFTVNPAVVIMLSDYNNLNVVDNIIDVKSANDALKFKPYTHDRELVFDYLDTCKTEVSVVLGGVEVDMDIKLDDLFSRCDNKFSYHLPQEVRGSFDLLERIKDLPQQLLNEYDLDDGTKSALQRVIESYERDFSYALKAQLLTSQAGVHAIEKLTTKIKLNANQTNRLTQLTERELDLVINETNIIPNTILNLITKM